MITITSENSHFQQNVKFVVKENEKELCYIVEIIKDKKLYIEDIFIYNEPNNKISRISLIEYMIKHSVFYAFNKQVFTIECYNKNLFKDLANMGFKLGKDKVTIGVMDVLKNCKC